MKEEDSKNRRLIEAHGGYQHLKCYQNAESPMGV